MFLARLLSQPKPFAKPEDTSLDGHGGPEVPQQCAVFVCLEHCPVLAVCFLFSAIVNQGKNQKSLKTGELF